MSDPAASDGQPNGVPIEPVALVDQTPDSPPIPVSTTPIGDMDPVPSPLKKKTRSKSVVTKSKITRSPNDSLSPSTSTTSMSTDSMSELGEGEDSESQQEGQASPEGAEPAEKKKKKRLKLVIGEIIGKGAAAEVHKAVNEETGEVCAIKKMKKAGMKTEQLQAVALEVELSKQLKHPNIVDVKGSLEDKNFIYLILEYVDGGSLSSLLKQYGPYPPAMAGAFIKQVLKGLVYLHSESIIHRDIKAANILLSNDGQVKLADFGVSAKLKTETEKRYTVVGTPYWMAPEVITMSGHTTASDIWSVGCTVLELLTGHPPYWDLDQMRAIFCVVQDAHPPIPDNFPAEVKDFVLKCFEKDPTKRPTAQELLEHPWLESSGLESLIGQEASRIDFKSVRRSLKSMHKAKTGMSKKKRKTTSLDSVVQHALAAGVKLADFRPPPPHVPPPSRPDLFFSYTAPPEHTVSSNNGAETAATPPASPPAEPKPTHSPQAEEVVPLDPEHATPVAIPPISAADGAAHVGQGRGETPRRPAGKKLEKRPLLAPTSYDDEDGPPCPCCTIL